MKNSYRAVFLILFCVALLNMPDVPQPASAAKRVTTQPPSLQNPQSAPYQVEVQVLDENEDPIEGVRVQIRNRDGLNQMGQELFDGGVTDSFGVSTVALASDGKFRIEVAKDGFRYRDGEGDDQPRSSSRTFVSIPGRRVKQSIQIILLKSTAAREGRFRVTVRVVDGADRSPLPGAQVVIRNSAAAEKYEVVTDAAGIATAEANQLDGNFQVEISKEGYKSESSTFRSKGNRQSDVKIPIELAKELKYTVRFNVRVTNFSDRNPVQDAKVQLRKDGSFVVFDYQTTNGAGEASFVIADSGEYKVSVTHGNFAEDDNSQTVTVRKYDDVRVVPLSFSLIRKGDEDARKKKEEEKAAEAAAASKKKEEEALKAKEAEEKLRKTIEDELGRLTREVTEARLDFDALETGRSYAESVTTNLKKDASESHDDVAQTRLISNTVLLPATAACLAVSQVKSQIDAAAGEAERKEREAQQQLDEAENTATNCTDASAVQSVRNNYNRAIQALAASGSAAKTAAVQNTRLKGLANDVAKAKASLEKYTIHKDRMATRLKSAQSDLNQLSESIARNQQLLTRVSVNAPALRARVIAKAVEWKQQNLPTALKAQIERLEVYGAALQTDTRRFNFQTIRQAAEANVALILADDAEADRLLKPFREACANIDTTDADAEVARIDSVLTSLTIEVADAASLSAKAATCVENLKKPGPKKKPLPKEEVPESVEETPESTEAKPATKAGATWGLVEVIVNPNKLGGIKDVNPYNPRYGHTVEDLALHNYRWIVDSAVDRAGEWVQTEDYELSVTFTAPPSQLQGGQEYLLRTDAVAARRKMESLTARIGWFEVSGAKLETVRTTSDGGELPTGSPVGAGNFGGGKFVDKASIEFKLIVPLNGPDEIVIIEKASGTVAILKYLKGATPKMR